MEHFGMFIDGERCEAAGGAWFDTDNPYTAAPWAKVAKADAADADRAVQAAYRAFTSGDWPKMKAADRGKLLHRLGDLVVENFEELAQAETRDNGKVISETRNQMRTMAGWYHYYAGLADKVQGDTVPVDEDSFLNYTRFEPVGVCVAITPWNSPLRLLSWKLAPALAAGNTMVIKPSSNTSTSTLVFMRLVEEAGFPAGVVNVVTGGGGVVGMALVEHPLTAKVAFTGSTEAGTLVYEAGARHLKRVSLELGGKSPNILFADADLEKAIPGVVAGIFASTGQTCIAGSRLLVQDSVHDVVLNKIVAVATSRKMGDPTREDTQLGPVATASQFDKIMEYVDVAKSDGATLACGGTQGTGPECGDGRFISATVFDGVENNMRIAQEEVFGPVLSVIRFKDDAEAVRIANDVDFGLAAGIWTENLSRAHKVARGVQSGTIWINTYRQQSPMMPFGGYKKSGLGRESGSAMIREYLQQKSVWVGLD